MLHLNLSRCFVVFVSKLRLQVTSNNLHYNCCQTGMLKFVSLWACLWVSYINTAQHAVHAKLIAPPLARHQGRSGSGVPGYTQLHDTDCAVAACQTIKRLDLCGSPPAYPLLPPCNTTYLASLCDELAGCAGFNTNGWAKQAIPPRSSLENTSACDL